jgi:RNA polymerase sigma factor (sigma-70 family)
MATRWAEALLQQVHQAVTPRVDHLSDRELLQRFVVQRDSASFRSLVERHRALVWHVCRRVLANWHDAEDAFQATFLVLSRKAGSIRRTELLAGWLHGVAFRTALKARDKAGRRQRLESGGSAVDAVYRRPPPDPLAELSVREAQEILDQELERLPEKYRTPLILCCLEGRAREEAARQLGWPPSLVKTRLEEARERLRQRLTRRGLALPTTLGAGLLLDSVVHAGASPTLVFETVGAATAFSTSPVAAGAVAGTFSLRAAALAEEILASFFVAS